MQKYGQHFLVNKGIIEKIVSAAAENMLGNLVEIGPGKGALTFALLERGFDNFTLVEIDPEMIEHLRKTLPAYARLNIIEGDFLKVSPCALPQGDLTFISNLPYINAADILLKVLDMPSFKAAVFMFQREQALKLTAAPRGKNYGALSVLFQAFAQARSVCRVSRGSFNPPPKVDGEVVLITPAAKRNFTGDAHKKNFKELVKTAFTYRRKTLLNALGEAQSKNKDAAAKILNACGVKISARAEELPAAKYIELAKRFEDLIF